MVQSARALQRISQYAIARPSREVLFTVMDQQSKYKAKNVIDTVVSLWRSYGSLDTGGIAHWRIWPCRYGGIGGRGLDSLGFVAVALGRRYEAISGARGQAPVVSQPR